MMRLRNFNVIGYDMGYWWLQLSGGVAFMSLGLYLMIAPERAYLSLSLFLAIGMLVSGLFECLISLFNHRKISDWGWIFTGGAIDIAFGIYLLNYPILTMIFMPMVIGIWMMFRAFMTVSSPVALKAIGMAELLWLLTTSVLLTLPSIVILVHPFAVIGNMVKITGIAFLASGIYKTVLSQRLRKLKKFITQ